MSSSGHDRILNGEVVGRVDDGGSIIEMVLCDEVVKLLELKQEWEWEKGWVRV